MVMGTGGGSTVSFLDSPTQPTPAEFHQAKAQHHEKEFLVLERVLKYKRQECGAGCVAPTSMASFSTDELGWGCGKLFCSSKMGRISGVGSLAWVPSHLLPAWK